ncbi:MAG: DUF6612 family protein [Bacillota bacterium]
MRRTLFSYCLILSLFGCSTAEPEPASVKSETKADSVSVPSLVQSMEKNLSTVDSYSIEAISNQTFLTEDEYIFGNLEWNSKSEILTGSLDMHHYLTLEDRLEPDPDLPNPIIMDMYFVDGTIYSKTNHTSEWVVLDDASAQMEEGKYKDSYQVAGSDLQFEVFDNHFQLALLKDYEKDFILGEQEDRYQLILDLQEEDLGNVSADLIQLAMPNYQEGGDMQVSANEYKVTIYIDKETLYPEKTFIFSSFNISTSETDFLLQYDFSSTQSNFNEFEGIEIPAEAIQ